MSGVRVRGIRVRYAMGAGAGESAAAYPASASGLDEHAESRRHRRRAWRHGTRTMVRNGAEIDRRCRYTPGCGRVEVTRGERLRSDYRGLSRLWSASHWSLTGGREFEPAVRRINLTTVMTTIPTPAPAAAHHTFMCSLSVEALRGNRVICRQ